MPALPGLLALLVAGAGLPGQTTRLAQVDRQVLPLDSADVRVIATGDVDGDGDLDVVLGRPRTMLLLNQGNNRFRDASAQLGLPPGDTTGLAFGDLDGDGDLDLVVGTNRGLDRLLFNDGKGTFRDGTQGNLAMDGGATTVVALADLDGDKDLDLVVGSQWSRGTSVQFNDGRGKFRLGSQTLPTSIVAMHPYDMDGDGDTDLLTLARGVPMVWRNDGKGVLQDVTASHMPNQVQGVTRMAAGDVDRDGDTDLVVGTLQNGDLLLINTGKGVFVDRTAGRLPQSPEVTAALLLVDLTGDGAPELVRAAANLTSPAMVPERVLGNDGKGTFTDRTAAFGLPPLGFQVRALAAADLDGDGLQDFLVGGDRAAARLVHNLDGARLAIANDPFLVEDLHPTWDLAVGDFDGDGAVDVVFAGDGLRLLLGDGRGRFQLPQRTRIPPFRAMIYAVVAHDFDGDGDLDLVLSDDKMYLNDGKGNFTDVSARLPKDPIITRHIAVGDVDGDGDADLYLAKQFGQNRLYLNDGKGNFSDATATALPAEVHNSFAAEFGDIDGDGDLDLVVGNRYWNRTSPGTDTVYFNDGRGRFNTTRDLPHLQTNTQDLALADFDGDGDLDLMIASAHDTAGPARDWLYFNDGKGTFTDVSATHFPNQTEHTWSIDVGDVDGDGDLDVVQANNLPLWSLAPQTLQNRLFINDGKGRFRDATAEWMPTVLDYSTDLVLVDVDGDRDLDLLVANDSTPRTNLVEQGRERVFFNLTDHLVMPDLAQRSLTYRMRFWHWEGTTSKTVVVLPLLSLGALRVPLPGLGTLGVDPSQGILLPSRTFPPNARALDYPVAVPSDPSLRGLRFYSQALLADPSRPVFRFTNAVAEWVY